MKLTEKMSTVELDALLASFDDDLARGAEDVSRIGAERAALVLATPASRVYRTAAAAPAAAALMRPHGCVAVLPFEMMEAWTDPVIAAEVRAAAVLGRIAIVLVGDGFACVAGHMEAANARPVGQA